MKQFESIEITEEQKKEIYDIVESAIDLSFDVFESVWGNTGSKKFMLLGVLKARGDEKAIELWNKLDKGHRQTKRNIIKKANEEIKLQEILKNKNRFIGECKANLDDDDKKLKILKIIDCSLGSMVVIGCTYTGQNLEPKTGGTTAIYEWITPGLYEDVLRTYPRYE